MNKSVGPWKVVYLADDLYCVKRDVFYPDTDVTTSEHVRRDDGCIEAFSMDEAMTVASDLNRDFLGLTHTPTPAI